MATALHGATMPARKHRDPLRRALQMFVDAQGSRRRNDRQRAAALEEQAEEIARPLLEAPELPRPMTELKAQVIEMALCWSESRMAVHHGPGGKALRQAERALEDVCAELASDAAPERWKAPI